MKILPLAAVLACSVFTGCDKIAATLNNETPTPSPTPVATTPPPQPGDWMWKKNWNNPLDQPARKSGR